MEQAIDRWTLYLRLCRKAIISLRESMVENYVKHAVEANSESSQSVLTDIIVVNTRNETSHASSNGKMFYYFYIASVYVFVFKLVIRMVDFFVISAVYIYSYATVCGNV